MSPLAAAIALMLTWYVTRDLAPVYAVQLRRAPLGAEARAAELADELEAAAAAAGVDFELLAAIELDESGFDALRVGAVGELGGMQLLPESRWGRGWLRECEQIGLALGYSSWWACEPSNVRWGAYALRAALDECGGDEHAALGFYRTGKCVRGPRGALTLEVAEWLRARLGEEGSRRVCAAEERGRHVQGAQQAGLPGRLEGGADFGRSASRGGARDRERVRGGVRADDAVQRQRRTERPERGAAGAGRRRAARARRRRGRHPGLSGSRSSARGKGAG